jgi:hypothetical protein
MEEEEEEWVGYLKMVQRNQVVEVHLRQEEEGMMHQGREVEELVEMQQQE